MLDEAGNSDPCYARILFLYGRKAIVHIVTSIIPF